MNSFLDNPAFIKIFIYITNLVSRVPVGDTLLININIYGDYFLRHDSCVINQRYIFIEWIAGDLYEPFAFTADKLLSLAVCTLAAINRL